jgi:alpha-galactosidase
MTKITLIGAGSISFTRNISSDILLTPALQDATISLMDIDPVRLDMAKNMVEAIVRRRGLKAKVEASLDRRVAMKDTDFVITTFQVGGLNAFKMDIEIPLKYGVSQNVGDTLGPGSVFRALRTLPVMESIVQDLADVAPNAMILNYVNPMAAVCWGINTLTGWKNVGLCHAVQGSLELLASWIDVPPAEINFVYAGLNHHGFFLEFKRGSQDLYPALWKAIERPEVIGQEPIRIELMKALGYFMTESSGHNSEYVPWFRKSEKYINEVLVPQYQSEPDHYWFDYGRSGGYLKHCIDRQDDAFAEYAAISRDEAAIPTTFSIEYGAEIINAMVTNQPMVFYGNVKNDGLIPNLPDGCCVEVACVADGHGIRPTYSGPLPPQCAAILRTNVNVQELIVHAAKTHRVEAVHHAVMMDPLVGAVCTLPQIHAMTDEMLAAQSQWLPYFKS